MPLLQGSVIEARFARNYWPVVGSPTQVPTGHSLLKSDQWLIGEVDFSSTFPIRCRQLENCYPQCVTMTYQPLVHYKHDWQSGNSPIICPRNRKFLLCVMKWYCSISNVNLACRLGFLISIIESYGINDWATNVPQIQYNALTLNSFDIT